MINEELNNFLEEVISKLKTVTGVDLIYFLDSNHQIVKEHKTNNTDNYFQQVLNIVKSEALIPKTGELIYKKPFHTYTLLNEKGMMVILRLNGIENLCMIIIAGEKQPVDLITLLKICKESRQHYENFSITNA